MQSQTNEQELSWQIWKDCVDVLRENPKMGVFVTIPPVVTLVSILLALSLTPEIRSIAGWAKETLPLIEHLSTQLLGAYIAYVIVFFLSSLSLSFCNVALIKCTKSVIDNEEPSILDGLSASLNNLFPVIASAVLTSTVGFILLLAERKGFGVAKLTAYVLGASYAVVTFFALPVAVLESKGVLEMYPRSAFLVRERFGEVIKVGLGVYGVGLLIAGAIMTALILPVLGITLFGFDTPGISFLLEKILFFILETAEGLALTGLLMSLAISAIVVSISFAAIVKTVLYVDTVEGRRPRMLKRSVKYVDEMNRQKDESEFNPTEIVQ